MYDSETWIEDKCFYIDHLGFIGMVYKPGIEWVFDIFDLGNRIEGEDSYITIDEAKAQCIAYIEDIYAGRMHP